MKTLLTIIFLITLNSGFCFKDTLKYNLSNELGYFYSNSHSANFQGENSFNLKNYQLSFNTSYAYSNSNYKIEQNEFLNKTSFSYNNWFVNHIFNTSYSRKIKTENLIGIGYVHKFKKPMSISYGFMIQDRQYYYAFHEYKLRHSFRIKFKIKYKLINILYECYYKPNIIQFNDFIIYSNAKMTLFEDKGVSLAFSDNINYQSAESVKLVHSFSIGINFKLSKK